jgi:hypothetical protein
MEREALEQDSFIPNGANLGHFISKINHSLMDGTGKTTSVALGFQSIVFHLYGVELLLVDTTHH